MYSIGGFAPFGISGIIGGAAKAFYAYIGRLDLISLCRIK
jgi:hypothetical protein